MKPTVYIETTIVGHLTSRLPTDIVVAGQMLETRRWWTESQDQFDLFVSQTVLVEVARGDPVAAAERLEAIKGVPLIAITDAAKELAVALITQNALPSKARVDALHLATAATNGIQYLLTWNCRHLANAAMRAKIEETCKSLGYKSPVICTPAELGGIK